MDKKEICKKIINPNIKKIVLSPHYDDLVLSLGGLALKWKENNCIVEDWIIFSNSSYSIHNIKDTSKKKIKEISKIRLKEEQKAVKELKISKIRLCNQNEALNRGYKIDNLNSSFSSLNEQDKIVLQNIKKRICPLLSKKIQIFVPMGIGNVDHHILKRAVNSLLMQYKKKADIFFYEDLPYISVIPKDKLKRIIKNRKLSPINIPFNLKHKISLIDLYKSQKNNSYYNGVIKRSRELGKYPCERIYFEKPEIVFIKNIKNFIKKNFLQRKKLVIGLGSGRCGTCSLAHLLDKQKNFRITHETLPSNIFAFSKFSIDKKLKKLLKYKGKFVGDVALYYLPYIEYILKKYPSTKFICLKRSKKETINSFMRATPFYNHWTDPSLMKDKGEFYIDYKGKKWTKHYWNNLFPNYNNKSKEKAIGLYWEDYYKKISELKKKYPRNIIILNTREALNSKKGISKMLSFIGIPKKHQKLLTNLNFESVKELQNKSNTPLPSVFSP